MVVENYLEKICELFSFLECDGEKMNQHLIYYPCFAMIVLTVSVLIYMFRLRVKDIKQKRVSIKQFRTYQEMSGSSELALQATRNFTNLFEVPTLFYAVCLFALVMEKVSVLLLILAWLYVALRLCHSLIHLMKNNVIHRMFMYGASWVVLLVMAVIVAL